MSNIAKGKVVKVYPNTNSCYVQLEYAGVKPKDEYFKLELSHPNYKSLYSLAVLSAIHNYELAIRSVSNITPSEHAIVSYMYVEWQSN